MRKVVALATIMLAMSLSGCSKAAPETLRDMHNGIGRYMNIQRTNIENPLSVLDKIMLNDIVQSASNTIEENKSKVVDVQVDEEQNLLNLNDYIEVVKIGADNKEFGSLEELSNSDIHLAKYYGNEVEKEATIYLSIDFQAIDNWCEDMANKYYIKYIAPSVGFRSGVTSVNMGVTGRSVSLDDLKSKVYSAINDKTYSVKVSTENQIANTTEEDLMAIQKKVASFSTGYSSSGASRRTNIEVAAKNINGTLLLPGETVSVDRAIKSRNRSNGYAKAGSYLNGKTVQTYGGGVCQVSTTLYGAILRAGIIPIERNAHSMSVGYVPLGLDAAISEGYKDLKIQNTYSTPIYIEAIANGGTLTFNIWGREGITEGKTFKPRSVVKSALRAEAYLDVYDASGNKIETKQLKSSNYKPHK